MQGDSSESSLFHVAPENCIIKPRSGRNPLALKTWTGVDPLLSKADLRLERARCQRLIKSTENVYANFPRPEAEDTVRDNIRTRMVRALRAAHTYRKDPLPDPMLHKLALHRHRRIVAGYAQELSLQIQGVHAYQHAVKEKLLIFEGHRWVWLNLR